MHATQTASMSLLDLSFTTFVYATTSHFDSSLEELRSAYGEVPDLSDPKVVEYVLSWLRKWKCRNFELNHQRLSVASIVKWNSDNKALLDDVPKDLSQIDDSSLRVVAKLFDDLSDAMATPAKRVGPTAASKIIYLLKPSALPPWDEPIRAQLRHSGNGKSYADYVRSCRRIAEALNEQCLKEGLDLETLISHGRTRKIGVAKALDEYYWTTITNKFKPPMVEEFKIWCRLAT